MKFVVYVIYEEVLKYLEFFLLFIDLLFYIICVEMREIFRNNGKFE